MKVVVVGAGEVGYQIAAKLVQEKADVVLIDTDSQRLEVVSESLDVQTIEGYGSNPETLAAAGLAHADLVVAVTGNDETNILTCRMVQLLAPPETQRVARIRASGYYEFFEDRQCRSDFGLNYIINPSQEVVETIMDFIKFPGTADVIEMAKGQLRLVGAHLPQSHPMLGEPLSKLRACHTCPSDLLIAAIYRRHNLVIPRGDSVMKAGDLVYVAVGANETDKVSEFFGLNHKPIRNIIIVGGGEVGYMLAKKMDKDERRFNVKLIETSQRRCEYLSERLKRVMVIRGDGTDKELLMEENVSECDYFIAVSTNDENNLISCLVAKRLGVRHTITRVNRFSYAPLVQSIGLEAMVSARLAAVSAVLKYIRKGRVVSVATLANEDAEIIEYKVIDKSKLIGKQLSEVKVPSGALIAAITRKDQVIIPRGNTVIEAGDAVSVVSKAEVIPEVENLLSH